MTSPSEKSIARYFVDEAGDPNLFSGKGNVLVGSEGCSHYFLLGKLHVGDPDGLTKEMEELRASLLTNPYFRGIASMQPAARKTALKFHAKDDVPEVRREVYKLLLTQVDKIRFYGVVRDKRELASHEAQKRDADPKYRYRPNDLYDRAVGERLRARLRGGEQGRGRRDLPHPHRMRRATGRGLSAVGLATVLRV